MSFFKDPKPPEPPVQVVQEKQWWPAVIVVLILTAVGTVIGWMLKPLLTYLFTFEGRTPNQQKTQVTLIVLIFGGALFTLYQIPAMRDFVSLAKTHTINISNGYRVLFPDSSTFRVQDRRVYETYDSKIYWSYAGYTGNRMQKISSSECQKVVRGELMSLASLQKPVQAEGFEDEVTYPIRQSVPDIRGWRYASYVVAHPSYLFMSPSERAATVVQYETSSSWQEFLDNWSDIPALPDGHTPFTVKALSREHAVICF
ncbi:MAG: hypothetical protein ACAH17_03165 [Candidatus Paceibacterota bacterium]